jgi:hypothetical protein
MKQQLKIIAMAALLPLVLINCNSGPTASKQDITITSPAAGDKLLAGDTISVKWTQSVSSPIISYNYHLAVSSPWVLFAPVIIVSPQEGKVVLPIEWYAADSFQIKVEDGTGENNPGFSAYLPEKYIFLTSAPATGATIKVGDAVTIAWRHNPSLFSSIEVLLSTDGGKSFNTIIKNSLPKTTESMQWKVGEEEGWKFTYPSSSCIVQVRNYDPKSIKALSGIFQVQ